MCIQSAADGSGTGDVLSTTRITFLAAGGTRRLKYAVHRHQISIMPSGRPGCSSIWADRASQNVFYCPAEDSDYNGSNMTRRRRSPIASDTGFGYNIGESLLFEGATPSPAIFSYGYNDWGAWDPSGNLVNTPSSTQIRFSSAASVLICGTRRSAVDRAEGVSGEACFARDHNRLTYPGREPLTLTLTRTTPKQAPGTIHRGGGNFLYCDGHVEWHLQKDLILYNPTESKYSASIGNLSIWSTIAPQWNNNFLLLRLFWSSAAVDVSDYREVLA